MKPKQMNFLLMLVGSAFFIVVSCNSSGKSTSGSATETDYSESGQAYVQDADSEPNALNLAMSSKDHTVLVKAVQAAEIENALVNVGPLTVFAPNDAAFAKVDEATLNDLLKPENKSQLAFILTHHVAPSNYPIETLQKNAEKNRKLYMASGQYLEVKAEDNDIFVGGKKILGTVKVSNGWVHIIDEVLLPSN